MTMHEPQPMLNPDYSLREFRFYMVGKLIRQDLGGDDEGYRQTLVCPCHHQYVKVIGPSRYELARYMAYCTVTTEQLTRADTMEQIWANVEELSETGDPAGVKTVTAAVQEPSHTQ